MPPGTPGWAQRATAGVKSKRVYQLEHNMPKGVQRSNKMSKKPKKDSSLPKESSSVSTRPIAPTTAVMPKGKLKNKEGN